MFFYCISWLWFQDYVAKFGSTKDINWSKPTLEIKLNFVTRFVNICPMYNTSNTKNIIIEQVAFPPESIIKHGTSKSTTWYALSLLWHVLSLLWYILSNVALLCQ